MNKDLTEMTDKEINLIAAELIVGKDNVIYYTDCVHMIFNGKR